MMICLKSFQRNTWQLEKIIYDGLINRTRTLAFAAQYRYNSSYPPPVTGEIKNRISTLCSRYSPSRSTYQLQFNDFIKLKGRLKRMRYGAIIGGYVFGCFTFASNSTLLFPWLMSDSPIMFL